MTRVILSEEDLGVARRGNEAESGRQRRGGVMKLNQADRGRNKKGVVKSFQQAITACKAMI